MEGKYPAHEPRQIDIRLLKDTQINTVITAMGGEGNS